MLVFLGPLGFLSRMSFLESVSWSCCIYIYLRRQQERDLMQKARLLTDENSVSFQMFPILLSSITLCSESQIPVFKEGQSNT